MEEKSKQDEEAPMEWVPLSENDKDTQELLEMMDKYSNFYAMLSLPARMFEP